MEGSTLAVHTESVSADGTCFIPFLVSGWSTLMEDLRRGSNWSSPSSEGNGGSSNPWQTSADLSPPLGRSSVSVDHPLTRKGIEPRLAPDVSSASASIKEIALAAATVTRNCVQNQAPTTGGLVERFGSVSIGQTSSETTEDK